MAGTEIYQLLKEDHQAVAKMFNQILGVGSQGLGVQGQMGGQSLLQTLGQELAMHMRAEEMTFYAELEKNAEAKEMIAEARKEHQQGEKLLSQVQGFASSGPEWRTMTQDLKSAIDHHISEEEGKIFATARKVLSQSDAEMIGQRFQSQKQQLKR